MSVNLGLTGTPAPPVTTILTTSEADIYVPTGSNSVFNVLSITVLNKTSGAVVAELYWNDGTTSYMFWRRSVAANETVICEHFLSLLPGATNGQGVPKKLRALAGSNSAIHVTPSVTQIGSQK